ncbi:beta/alpha barrel domain-containing protein [Flavilitoribacter nigricans]|uniref:Type 2 isopentenyl-diphosphate Delta-isomerase n=1 Tax=Flavilitoribacter nigricans (strain ATCC 23147 / DSM 23189 / NBRC 102662 / NCIMB 1420 / SS-2) TaxID=1122177 RepID=A0A2D0N3P9_FLAN2|nr:type 2 isopentenyl-diphosphate Delta-isomerase [Flavilitoribacter nigricans]PHN03006.1 type 2 isopentenyl-diphosphate Delta-isomerase [Flavilitoribacter nigricans DSM 23189 = NBRC 102662]
MSEKQNNNLSEPAFTDDDPTAASRKKDHIEMAFASQVVKQELDSRFYYEPLLSAHPEKDSWPAFSFLNKTMKVPLWVSSMTGGTAMANTINHNLARACGEFGMGMGLGSCRSLLYSDENLADFAVRKWIGEDHPLFANLGVAQLEQLLDKNELYRVNDLIDKVEADGLIVHVNPFQEWLQPEGDRFRQPPLDTIRALIDQLPDLSIIVKEVGQGMGRESLRQLFQLPLTAIDFAANGGTNFAKLELLRSDARRKETYAPLALVGHSAEDMVELTNELVAEMGAFLQTRQVIISGGVKDFLDGYYLINKIDLSAVYGQASGFLRHARGDYESLRSYVITQIEGLELARAYLRLR